MVSTQRSYTGTCSRNSTVSSLKARKNAELKISSRTRKLDVNWRDFAVPTARYKPYFAWAGLQPKLNWNNRSIRLRIRI